MFKTPWAHRNPAIIEITGPSATEIGKSKAYLYVVRRAMALSNEIICCVSKVCGDYTYWRGLWGAELEFCCAEGCDFFSMSSGADNLHFFVGVDISVKSWDISFLFFISYGYGKTRGERGCG